jgi:hypothetical protein
MLFFTLSILFCLVIIMLMFNKKIEFIIWIFKSCSKLKCTKLDRTELNILDSHPKPRMSFASNQSKPNYEQCYILLKSLTISHANLILVQFISLISKLIKYNHQNKFLIKYNTIRNLLNNNLK